jgi:hypothetical protein
VLVLVLLLRLVPLLRRVSDRTRHYTDTALEGIKDEDEDEDSGYYTKEYRVYRGHLLCCIARVCDVMKTLLPSLVFAGVRLVRLVVSSSSSSSLIGGVEPDLKG